MNERLNENSPDREVLPWHEQIRRRAESFGYNVKAWEVSGEGAIAAVMSSELCMGSYTFLFGTTQKVEEVPRLKEWQDWQIFKDYSEVFPALVAYHSCTRINPKSRNKRVISSLLNESKSLIRYFEEKRP